MIIEHRREPFPSWEIGEDDQVKTEGNGGKEEKNAKLFLF